MERKEVTKEELKKENSELERRLDELRSNVYNLKSKNAKLEEELEDREDRLKKLTNQIHFLAWMLHKEWVSLENNMIRWLDVIIEQKIAETKDKPSYISPFTYASK